MNSQKCCNLCGSFKIKRLYSLKDDQIGVYEKQDRMLDIEKCGNCGLIFIGNIRDIDKLHRTFWKEVVKDISARVERSSFGDYGAAVKIADQYRKNNRVLDVGCGDGRFLRALKAKGWNEFGVEVAPEAVDYARDVFKLNIIRGMIEDINFPDDYFDVVSMWGVIEHLRNPQQVLRKVHNILREEGLLLLYTPNALSLFHKLARLSYLSSGGTIKYPLRRLFVAMHLYYFSPETISRILADNGIIPFKICRKNINLEAIFSTYADRGWARSSVTRSFIRAISILSSVLRMQSHILIYATNKKG